MDKIKYLLDTNICIHFMKNDQNVIQKIKDVGFENCYLSEIVVLELLYGVEGSESERKDENRVRFEKFEDSFGDRILSIRSSFQEFSNQKSRLKKLAFIVSDFDLLIGCTAITNEMILASRNTKDMNKIDGLKLENWID
jgi:tRNA(fMet)-specific endonuclease VapC